MTNKLARRIAEAVAAASGGLPEHLEIMADEFEPIIAAELPPECEAESAPELLKLLERARNSLEVLDSFGMLNSYDEAVFRDIKAVLRAKYKNA